jgi:hypothetical protein
MAENPKNYSGSIISAESGRVMTRGEKLVSFKIQGRIYSHYQPGWWCSLTDPSDAQGQLVDDDNQVAEMARRTAKALAHGEKVFVPVVIRAIRQLCDLTQRQAGMVFGTGFGGRDSRGGEDGALFNSCRVIRSRGVWSRRAPTEEPAGLAQSHM